MSASREDLNMKENYYMKNRESQKSKAAILTRLREKKRCNLSNLN
jgi:hypothetical protein